MAAKLYQEYILYEIIISSVQFLPDILASPSAPIPVTRMTGAIASDRDHLAKLQHQGPSLIRAQPRNAHLPITRIDLRLRVFVAVAVPNLEYRQARVNGIQESWRGRSAAAVIGHRVRVAQLCCGWV
jgi:hypothetical protein